jgi:hypothetical protein
VAYTERRRPPVYRISYDVDANPFRRRPGRDMVSGDEGQFLDQFASERFRKFGQIHIQLGAPAIDAERFRAPGPKCPCGILSLTSVMMSPISIAPGVTAASSERARPED